MDNLEKENPKMKNVLHENQRKVERLFQIYRSEQNGWVYDVNGVSPTIMVGCHSGVAPMIIDYEER